MSVYKIVSVTDYYQLWSLFLEYHKEVSKYSNEMPLPEKNDFLFFWQEKNKWSYFLKYNDRPVGFVLLQKVPESNNNILELGAIYVRKNNRGFHSLKLYKKALWCANQNQAILSSEIALNNKHSLNIYKLLKKKYSQTTQIVFQEKKQ